MDELDVGLEAYAMITLGNPARRCVDVARELFDALQVRDFGGALRRLDQTGPRWSKAELERTVSMVSGGWITPWRAIKRSASPVISREGQDYVLTHPLPVDGKWHASAVVLRFRWKLGAYYHIELDSFTMSGQAPNKALQGTPGSHAASISTHGARRP